MVDNFTVGGGVQSGGPDARMSVKMNKIKDKNFFQKQQDEVLSNYIKSYNKNDKNN